MQELPQVKALRSASIIMQCCYITGAVKHSTGPWRMVLLSCSKSFRTFANKGLNLLLQDKPNIPAEED